MSTSDSLSTTDDLPACLVRDNLTSPYFPSMSAATLRVFVALCVIFTITSFRPLDHRVWSDLHAGRSIIQHGAPPPGSPLAAEPQAAWLSPVARYLVYQALGNDGLVLAHALVVTLIAGVLLLPVQAWLKRRQGPQPQPTDATAMRTVIAMGALFMTALVSPPSYALISGQTRGESQILDSGTPLYLADEVARRGITGTIAAPSDWAEYLVWRSEGRLRPLVSSSTSR